MRAFFLCVCLLVANAISMWGQQDLKLNYSLSVPEENGVYTSIKDLKFVFNLDNIIFESGTVDEYGIMASMSASRNIKLYQGNDNTGEVLATIRENIGTSNAKFHTGDYIEFQFPQEYILEEGQDYTLVISARALSLASPSVTGSIAFIPETSIHFKGGSASDEVLLCEEISPVSTSVVSNLDVVSLTFNQGVAVNEGAQASLYEGETEIATSSITVSSDNSNVVILDFKNVELWNSHKYKLIIPANSIYSESNPQLSYQEISIDYTGSSYHYHSYGRIIPSNGSEISYLATVVVPVNADGGLEIGRAKAPKAYLYKGDSEDPLVSIQCEMGQDGSSWIIPVWYFDFEASETYKVVIPADQYHLWYRNDNGVLVEAKDYTNPELVITYTTPEVLEKPAKVSIISSVPANEAECGRVDEVVLNFSPYEFEEATYLIYAASENPMAIFSDGTTETSVPIAFTNGTESASISINRPLESGKKYSLTIPANTFVPNVNENLANVAGNEEVVLTFNGVKEPSYEVSCNFGDAFTITNEVNRGESATLTFSPAEDWAIDEVIVNDESKTVEDNTLIIPDVNEETNVYVTYKYAGEISFDYETGVDNVMAECPYGVSIESGYVTISNVELGATIDVYNTVGMLMATSTATQSTMKLGVNPGIVVVVIRNADQTPVGITVKVPE